MFSSFSSAVRTAHQQTPRVLRRSCRLSALNQKGAFLASCLLLGFVAQDSAIAFSSYNNYGNSFGRYDNDYYEDDYYNGQGRSSRSSRNSYNSRRSQRSSGVDSDRGGRRSSRSSRYASDDASRYLDDMEDLLERADRDVVSVLNQIPDPYLQMQMCAKLKAHMVQAQLITKRAQQSWAQHQEKMQLLEELCDRLSRFQMGNTLSGQNGGLGLQTGLLNNQLGALTGYQQNGLLQQSVVDPTQQLLNQQLAAQQQQLLQQQLLQQQALQQPALTYQPQTLTGALGNMLTTGLNAVTNSTGTTSAASASSASSSGGRRR